MTYALTRDFLRCETGCFMFGHRGRPDKQSRKTWCVKANFVCYVIGKVLHDNSSASSGWMIEIKHKTFTSRIIIDSEVATSTVRLRRQFMNINPVLMARFTSDDFLDFVTEDLEMSVSSGDKIPEILCTKFCGKFTLGSLSYWVWPNITFCADSNPEKYVVLNEVQTSLLKPFPDSVSTKYKDLLHALGKATECFYGPRKIHALHVYSNALKSIVKDSIIESRNGMHVANLSGPPNIGKTFACVLATKMIHCDSLILSNTTASALLDQCHMNKSLLVTWDDPRDVSMSTMSTIIHEAFNGYSSSTLSKGTRNYNSCLIIGTQTRFLGLETVLHQHSPTLSRLSHIDMNYQTDVKPMLGSEKKLQALMSDLPSLFHLFVTLTYDNTLTEKLYFKLKKRYPNVLDRMLHIAAIDWNLCLTLNSCGMHFSVSEINEYFTKVYFDSLLDCCVVNVLQMFITDLKRYMHEFTENEIKKNVVVKHRKAVAVRLTQVYNKIASFKTVNYTVNDIYTEVKENPEKGICNHNVNYKSNGIKRSLILFDFECDTV